MSMKPLVSVLLANWNGGRFLSDTIGSVVNQTFEDWEMIVVDTGSDDDSKGIIEGWAAQDSRIKPLLKSEKMLCPPALNLGLSVARGQFIARIESDDLWREDKLEHQLEFVSRPGRERIGVCGSDVTLIDEEGNCIGLKRYPRTPAGCLRAIWYRNPFCHSAVLVRKAAFNQAGGYDEAFTLIEDLELWFRIGRFWDFDNVPVPLVNYRVWHGSLTSRRLRDLALRQHQVRARADTKFKYRPPAFARAYSFATLAVALLPPLWARKLFEFGVRCLGPSADKHNPALKRSHRQRVHGKCN